MKYKSASSVTESNPLLFLSEDHCRQEQKMIAQGGKMFLKLSWWKQYNCIHSQTQGAKYPKKQPLATETVMQQNKQISSPSLPRQKSLPRALDDIIRKVRQNLRLLHSLAETQKPLILIRNNSGWVLS